MADDERRAEIEAVKRTRPKVGALISAWRRYADDLEAALDRVRDARGDDEKQWACDACEDTGIDRREGIPCGCGARSPQGEDQSIGRMGTKPSELGHQYETRPEQPPPDKLGGQPPAEPRSHDDLWDNPAKGP